MLASQEMESRKLKIRIKNRKEIDKIDRNKSY